MSDALRQMMVTTDTEEACANEIASLAGWKLRDEAAVKRMRQCLNHRDPRHFSVDWQEVVLQEVAEAGGADLVTGILDRARRDGEYARMQQEPDGLFHAGERERFKPKRVEPRPRARINAAVE